MHYLKNHKDPNPFKCKKINQDESICTASFDTKEKLDDHNLEKNIVNTCKKSKFVSFVITFYPIKNIK